MLAEYIIGNEDVKEYLETMVKKENILHSYLFLGKSGVGKKEIAKAFSKLILCETKEENCTCKSCVCFDSNNHPDFELIDSEGETSIKIKKIRELNEKVYEKPIMSNKKVYIIDEAEKMTKEAQNALLKTLEEPPEFVTIILVSSNENLLLNTIKSRCIKIAFNNINDDEIKRYISDHLEYKNLSDNLLRYIDGSIGKAIELEGQEDHFSEIEKLLMMVNSLDIIDFLRLGKIIYDKDNINNYLEYMIVCLYSYSKKNKRYIYTIEYINNCIKMLKSNTNFDMCIDNMLMKIWEEINESSNRS